MAIGDIAWETIKTALEAINTALQGIAESVISLNSSQIIGIGSITAGLVIILGLIKKIADIGIKSLGFENIQGVKGLVEAYKKAGDEGNKTLKGAFKKIFAGSFGLGFDKIVDAVIEEFWRVKSAFLVFADDIYNAGVFYAISEAVKKIINLFRELGKFSTLRGILSGISGIITLVIGAFKTLWQVFLTNPIARVISLVVGIGAALVNTYLTSEDFRVYISQLFETCGEAFGGIAEAAGELWQTIKPIFSDYLIPLVKGLITVFTTVFEAIKDVIAIFITFIAGTFLSVVVSTFSQLAIGVINAIKSVIEIFTGFITLLEGVVTGDLDKIALGFFKIFKGLGDNLINLFKTIWNTIAGFINGFLRGTINAVNMVIKSINKIKLTIPDWVPGIGGKTFGGTNWSLLPVPQIPYLANGGVITSPTVAMMGEYAGAKNNPEIVAPQSILRETIENSNNNVVNALIQQTKQLLGALESMDMSVSIGDDVIAQAAQRGNQAYQRRTGKPLFA
jgi:hypothetical protein